MKVPKKIGVLRANALGDFILTLPALHSLKNTYPGSELVLLGRKSHAEFLRGRSGPVDRVITIPSQIQFDESIFVESQVKREFINQLKEEKFDLIIQLHGGGRYTNRFVHEISPDWSVGARTKDAPMLDENIPYTQFQHEVMRQLEIIERAGAKPSMICPELVPEDGEQQRALVFLTNHTKSQGPFVLINPGATDIRRRWPLKYFSDVSDKLIERGFRILINIGPDEEELGRNLLSLIRYKNSAFVISPALSDMTGILSVSDLVITNDTGTMHVAVALKRPVVALFWYGNLLNYGPLASGTTSVLYSKKTFCSRCGINFFEHICEHTDSWIDEIPVSSVVEASLELLNQNNTEGVKYEQNKSRSISW